MLVHVAFDGSRLTSEAGMLLLAPFEQRLGIASTRRIASRTHARRNGDVAAVAGHG
jgi:hypothetical protein